MNGIETVKIKRFTILENFQHDFKNHHTLICGKNAIGKSSIIKFMRIALGDTECIAPGIDIEGEVWKSKDGREYKFDVKMKGGKPVVTVTGPDGMSVNTRGVIAGITGAMNLNIPEFIEMSRSEKGRKTQVEIFKSFFPKEIIEGIDKMEGHVKVKYDERTQLNKDIKSKKHEVSTNPMDHLIDKELDKLTKVDVSATMVELKACQEHNSKIQRAVDKKALIDTEASNAADKVVELRNQLAKAESALKDVQVRQMEAVEWMAKQENQVKSTASLEELINSATETNKNFENAQKLKSDRALLNTMIAEEENYTIVIDSSRAEIQKTIKEMTTDLVPDLEFNENGLIYKGLPVHPDTHSTSERIRLGMRIKAAQNREIGVLFLENLESVDDDGMKAIIEEADALGMQVIGEQVVRNQKEMTFEIVGEKE